MPPETLGERHQRVAALARTRMGDAIDTYNTGGLTQVEYEAYRRAWAMAHGPFASAYRHATGWTTPTDDPAVETLAAEIVAYAQSRRS
jgi:hypothetical protein